MTPRCALLLVVLTAAVPRSVAAQGLTPNETAAFERIDANKDNLLTREEISAFFAELLEDDAIAAGMTEPADFPGYVAELTDRALNLALGDTVPPNRFRLLLQLDLTPIPKTLRDMIVAPTANPQPTRSRLDTLADWIDIRQSFLDQQSIGKPAKISVANRGGDDETVKPGDPRHIWSIQTAVIFNKIADKRAGRLSVTPTAAYEVNVTSNTPAKDVIAHRLGVFAILRRKIPTGPFPTHLIQATVDFKTDRDYDARVWGATVQYTPFYRQIGIGRYVRHGATVDLRWQPDFGWVHANVDRPGVVTAYQQMSHFDNLYARVTGEIRLGSKWRITPQTTFWHASQTLRSGASASNTANARSLASRWILSQSKKQETSFEIGFVGGRDAPDFRQQQVFTSAFGFKF